MVPQGVLNLIHKFKKKKKKKEAGLCCATDFTLEDLFHSPFRGFWTGVLWIYNNIYVRQTLEFKLF